MSVELVLKLLARVPSEFYELQKSWGNRIGGFKDFDAWTHAGVRFTHQFTDSQFPRGVDFPLSSLFDAIEMELKAHRFVIVSLRNSIGYHMYVIYDESPEDNFLAVSKDDWRTHYVKNLKDWITGMQGTDILTYTFVDESQFEASERRTA